MVDRYRVECLAAPNKPCDYCVCECSQLPALIGCSIDRATTGGIWILPRFQRPEGLKLCGRLLPIFGRVRAGSGCLKSKLTVVLTVLNYLLQTIPTLLNKVYWFVVLDTVQLVLQA